MPSGGDRARVCLCVSVCARKETWREHKSIGDKQRTQTGHKVAFVKL